MNYLTGITLAATVLCSAGALAEDTLATGSSGQVVVALADGPIARTSDVTVLERYVGRYETDNGANVLVALDGKMLTIEMPESGGLGRARLLPVGAGEFSLEGSSARVSFESDAAGSVAKLVVHEAAGDTPATKCPPRHGIVSIYDVDSPPNAAIASN